MTVKQLDFVHTFVPGNGAAAASTLLLLHGTGGNEHDLLGLGSMLAPGTALLSPRGKVQEQGMPRFFRRLAPGVFDTEDLQQRTHELADFVAAAASEYQFEPQRVAAVGYSNGANIAASTLLLRPGTLPAAVLFHPMVPLVPKELPNLSGTQVFIGAGQRDPITSPQEAERLAQMLESAGAAVVLHWHLGGHELRTEEVEAAAHWLRDTVLT